MGRVRGSTRGGGGEFADSGGAAPAQHGALEGAQGSLSESGPFWVREPTGHLTL